MRTVFMGTPEIAVPALAMLARRTQVALVITQPDRPAGRGMKLTPPPVKVAAEELGLPVWQPESMRGAEGDPRLAGHDLFVVMAYGELLRQPVLDLPRACINLHASLLPRWRGASPLQACIRAGDAETGVCVMGMVAALDAGPVYTTERIALGATTTLPELHDTVAATAATALGRFLDAWPDITATPQDDTLATVCRKLTAEHGRLDWSASAVELERQVRAYTPAPGCWTTLGGERLRVQAVRIAIAAGTAPLGTVRLVDGRVIVACGDGALELLRVQPQGGKAMEADAFARGRRDLDGAQLGGD
ncbi:MAG: methionyl-tRNA formyltransferase [Planctomycetes bacterium]|nr:methionyl-tRNA formyltransferase [Planctomycetota bacterium]